jgi:hypothetical protein
MVLRIGVFFGDHIALRCQSDQKSSWCSFFSGNSPWLSRLINKNHGRKCRSRFFVQDLDGFKGKMPKGQGAAAGGFGAAK